VKEIKITYIDDKVFRLTLKSSEGNLFYSTNTSLNYYMNKPDSKSGSLLDRNHPKDLFIKPSNIKIMGSDKRPNSIQKIKNPKFKPFGDFFSG